MACCVLAAFILTQIAVFFRKGVGLLLLPFGARLATASPASGVQWSAFEEREQEEHGFNALPARPAAVWRFRAPAGGWSALSGITPMGAAALAGLILLELGVVGGLGVHLIQHGTDMLAMITHWLAV